MESEEATAVIVDDGTLDRLEMRAQAMQNNFDAQMEYVAGLAEAAKANPELEGRLREARESVSQRWPLNEIQWIEWLEHEIDSADLSNPEAAKYVEDLCRRATQDYISVDLWLTYCDVVAQCCGDDEEQTRAAFEEAIASPSAYHIAEGAKIWEAYCEFERNFKRNDRVLKLYKRMFETPLSGMNMALASFDVWSHENNVPEEEIAAVHDKFNTTYVVYEKAIIQREQIIASTKENNWIDYARMLEALNTNFLCVCSTYERGIKEWPSSTELWRHYITYAEKCTDDKSGCTNDFLLSVYRRSFRNCQDCGTIWAGYIRLLERLGDPSGSIPALVAQARTYITSAEGYADVAHAYIGVCRRLAKTDFGTGAEPSEGVSALRDACRYAVSSIKGYNNKKAEAGVIQHWARIEYTLLKNPSQGHDLMEEAIKRLSADADAWLSYITLERFQGRNIPRCRSLYKRACDLVVKNIDQVVSSWLDFELDEGTPDEWKAAWTRGNKRLEEIETKRHNAEKKKQEEIESEKQKQREKQRARRERKRKRKEGTDDNDSAPDKVTQADDDKDSTHEAPPAKKAREDTTERSTINREEDRVNKRNEKTVHVSGLAKHAGEDDVRKFFSKYGEVMAVRMGKNKGTGEFAGYCFVEFSEPESAKAAIAAAASENKDDTDTTAATISDEAGLRVSVFKKRDPTKESVANNTNSTNRFEPRTLYLTNVSFKADKDVIRAFFNKGNCSGLKDIRIIRDLETGKSRGFAYIEFETDEDAEAALRMDKKPILGRAVKLRRSEAQQHPPEAYAQITQLQPNNDDKHLKQTPQVTLFKPRTLRNK